MIEDTILCGKCNKPKGDTEECCKCGRPLTYSKDILDNAEKYLELCQDEEVEQEKKEGFVTYKIKAKLPTKGGLARHLGVSRDTLYEWAKEYKEFSYIMETLGAEQEDRLINSGLSGDYNPTIAKVLLTKHGYIDKQDVTSDGKAIKGNTIMFTDFKDEADSK